MGKLISRCCSNMLRSAGWFGVPAEQRVCPKCLTTWAWQEGAWWKGSKLKVQEQ